MKKFISVLLTVIMIFSAVSVMAFAANVYDVTFADLPYDVAPFRSDYVGKYMGYEYGTDYWFTVTNEDGTTTDIKGFPYSVSVAAGDSLEFTVSIADYIEPTSLRMMAFPSSTPAGDLYDSLSGEPYEQYYIGKSVGNTYGLRPTEDMTVCVSEYNLFNKCFMYEFPDSDYYVSQRVQYNEGEVNPWDTYTTFEWGNTKVVYERETLFFEVRIPIDENYDYHYETYQVYYTTGDGSLDSRVTTYLKKPASSDGSAEAVDARVAHYETETEWVDVYAIENVDPTVKIKVAGTVTYTMAMLKQFFEDFKEQDIDEIDFDSIDFSPMVDYIIRIIYLFIKILRGFGLSTGG